jgi:hypothetical protein
LGLQIKDVFRVAARIIEQRNFGESAYREIRTGSSGDQLVVNNAAKEVVRRRNSIAWLSSWVASGVARAALRDWAELTIACRGTGRHKGNVRGSGGYSDCSTRVITSFSPCDSPVAG